MARQQGIIRFTGRLGNTVGYLAKDGKGNSFDASRVLAAQVTNPQTIAQMDQRMKMAPVVNFYRGLRGILDHSWQSVMYGEPSRLFFYSQTMRKLSTAGIPYINKGDKQFVPWAFPISSGSIPVVLIPAIHTTYTGGMSIGSIANEALDSESSVSDVSAEFLNTLGVEQGMQVTLLWVFNENGIYVPMYRRFILSSTDDTPLADKGIAAVGSEGGLTAFALYINDETYAGNLVACGVIVSKLVNNVWQRNNANMVISDSLRATYNSQAAYDAMLASYRQTTNSRDSDWYLNGGGDEGSSTVPTVTEVTLDTSTGEKTIAYYKVGASKYAPYYNTTDGGQPIINGYRKGGDMAFTKTGANSLGSGGFVDDLKTEYLALGYTLCTRAELLALAPDLTIPE